MSKDIDSQKDIDALCQRILTALYDKPPIMPIVLNTEQAGVYISTPPATLIEWRTERRKGFGPPWIKKGSFVRYRIADLKTWLDANAP